MNERIKELEKQATNVVEGWSDENGTTRYYEFNREKFAELIVRECCSTIERRYKYSNGTPVSFWEISQNVQDLLKKHFGVAE